MRVILVLIFLCNSLIASAQVLSAKVVDENNAPLVGATVYFDGTTRGVITNLDGVFNINKPKNLTEALLVITYLGYETLFEQNTDRLKSIYKLKPKAENLDSVNLYASPFSREVMLEVFRKNFLGDGKAARRCKILNIDDVIVYYKVKDNTLYASSLNPLVIQNDYLGYKVRFDLKAFEVQYNTKTLDEFYQKQSFFAGFSFFEDTDPDKHKRREKIYQRSLDNFFKALISKRLDETEFEVGYRGFIRQPKYVFGVESQADGLYKIFLKPEVIQTFNGKYIPSKIIVKYKSEMSTIQFQKPNIRVDRFGNNIDIQNILLIGDLSKNKLSKMLPTDFAEKN